MKFIKADIPDIIIIEPHVFKDERGYFFESFKQNELNEFLGYEVNFCQENESKSTYGALRGLHYQEPPFAQAKLVRVIQGSVLDVVVDIRKNSITFGKHFEIELNEENKKSFIYMVYNILMIKEAIYIFHCLCTPRVALYFVIIISWYTIKVN